tara:strand:- start:161 stop:439 length:279 start_codon:yes stop_codon:yes gene_type:complete
MNNKKTKNGFYLGIFSLAILIILGVNSKSSIFFNSYDWLTEGLLRLLSLGLASLGMIISLMALKESRSKMRTLSFITNGIILLFFLIMIIID